MKLFLKNCKLRTLFRMKETALERWDRGKTLLIESLFKPDTKLRGCAYNQNCYDEMMELRDAVIEYVKSWRR